MTPIIAYHVTARRHREGIETFGLLPNQPAAGRPFGIYVYGTNGEFDHPMRGSSWGATRVTWSHGRGQDVWQVAYIGPITPDRYVSNGLILLERIIPSEVTLVTGNIRG